MGHPPSGSMKVTFCDSYFRSNSRTWRVVIGLSNTAFLRRPNDFVQLDLKPNRQGIGDNSLGQFLARNWRLTCGDFFQRRMLLFRRERMNPGKQKRADQIEFMPG